MTFWKVKRVTREEAQKMAKLQYGVKHGHLSEGGQKMAKIQNGVKPDIFKITCGPNDNDPTGILCVFLVSARKPIHRPQSDTSLTSFRSLFPVVQDKVSTAKCRDILGRTFQSPLPPVWNDLDGLLVVVLESHSRSCT